MVTFNNSLTVSPEYEDARKRLEVLSEEYSAFLLEYEHMLNPMKDNLQADYMMKIGQKEYELFSLDLQIRQTRREITLYQAAINQGSFISEEAVNEIIKQEFLQYEEELKKQQKQIEKAKELFSYPKMPLKDNIELLALYRKLIKKLHPDIHPDLPPEASGLFQQAMDAYKTGDLELLKLLLDMTNDMLKGHEIKYDMPNTIDLLKKHILQIEQKIDTIKNKIESLKKEPPFCFEKLLNDSGAVMKKRKELDKQIDDYKNLLSQLQVIRNTLRNGNE